MIIAIEFDSLLGYDTPEVCQKWITNSPFWWALRLKSFNLRKRKSGFWISGEKRQVFAWTGELWRYKSLKITRPEPGIVVVEDGAGEPGVFSPTELPPPLLETVHKNAEKEAKKRQRKELAEARKKEAREKKGTLKRKEKKTKEIVPGMPAPAAKKKLKLEPLLQVPTSSLAPAKEPNLMDELYPIDLNPSQ